jgi:hypothetical protein
MAKRHTVQAGECVASIAFENGHFWQTLWDHPDNAELREARKNPWILREGDELVVPDLRRKVVTCATDTPNVFKLEGVPEQLRLRFGSPDFPRRGVRYVLTIDGRDHGGELDDNGELCHFLTPNATRAELTLYPEGAESERYVLALRGLEPIDTPRGVQMRLRNLQFYRGELDGELGRPEFIAAMQAFQSSAGIEPTAELDDTTRSALLDAHGC